MSVKIIQEKLDSDHPTFSEEGFFALCGCYQIWICFFLISYFFTPFM